MSPPFELKSRGGKDIKNVQGWGRHAKPASDRHWKKGRSAMELARLWPGDQGLEALRLLLDEQTGTSGFEPRRGIAEAQTRFDRFRGPRNHDLLLIGEAAGGKTVVSIEGKVDESFGQTLAQYRAAARRRLARGQQTDALDRLQGLTQAIAGWEAGAAPSRLQLRYQLFSAVAGTIAAAVEEEADQAVLCIHELLTKGIDEDKRKQNDADLRNFIYLGFGQRVTGSEDAWIVGPLTLHGGSDRIPACVPLYIAKLSTPPVSG